MRWSINKDGVNTGDVFDDGVIWASPGTEGFTREVVEGYLNGLGEGFTADYMGVSE